MVAKEIDRLANAFNDPKTREILLQALEHRYNFKIPSYIHNTLLIDTYEDAFMGDLVVALKMEVASMKDSKTVDSDATRVVQCVSKYPLTVWEYMKERYAPQWFLDKYPVRYQEYDATVIYSVRHITNITRIFPDITLRGDGKRFSVAIAEWD